MSQELNKLTEDNNDLKPNELNIYKCLKRQCNGEKSCNGKAPCGVEIVLYEKQGYYYHQGIQS